MDHSKNSERWQVQGGAECNPAGARGSRTATASASKRPSGSEQGRKGHRGEEGLVVAFI